MLQERINAGEIPAGSWLRQEALAKELGVSRMPVREALRELQARGGSVELIATAVPGYGCRRPGTSSRSTSSTACCRDMPGEAAAELITSQQLDRLSAAERLFRQAVEDLRTSDGDTTTAQRHWHEANTEFHAVIIEAGGNKHLAEMYENLHHKVPRNLTWIALGNDVRRLEKDAAEHAGILDAIGRGGDSAATRTLLTEHVKRASDLLVRTVDEIGQDSPTRRR